MYQTVHVFPQRVSITEETDPAGTGSELQTQKKYCTTKECEDPSDTLFIEPEGMQMQNRVYSSGSQYACSVCKKSFSQQNSLSNHLRVHQQPYKCDVCNKSFNRRSEDRKSVV
jgi:DNA-directed RNA polymerase subunit RPC12/RpoP